MQLRVLSHDISYRGSEAIVPFSLDISYLVSVRERGHSSLFLGYS